jgi:hypothetical protein
MFQDAHKRYGEAIETLREGILISRYDILALIKNDPYFVKDNAGDHAQYRHLYFPIRFGVIDHGTTDITSLTERRGHHKDLQLYIDTLKRLVYFKYKNPQQDWSAALEAQSVAFENYINGD